MKFIYYIPSEECDQRPTLHAIEAQNKQEALAERKRFDSFADIQYVYTLEEFWELI